MVFRLVFILALLQCFVALAEQEERPSPHAFEKVVAGLKEDSGARAVLAGMWVGDQEIARLALGDSMNGVPARPEMTVRIGGISQLFLGTLFMRLVEKGHIAPTDPVSKWLPDLYGVDTVTVEMLVSNTAGYKDYVLEEAFISDVLEDPFRCFSSQEIIQYAVGSKQMNFPPGTSQKYSHTEFTILREVLEKATGKSMAELYQSEILTPLGLSRTGYSTTPDLPSPVLHAYSSDRGVYEDCTFWDPSWAGESGPLYSNLDDLARWGPAFGEGRLLTSESFAQLVSNPHGETGVGTYFATGFVVTNGWYLQNPNINGYSGVFGYLPEEQMTLVVFATQPAKAKVDHPAMNIFRGLVKDFAPDHPLGF